MSARFTKQAALRVVVTAALCSLASAEASAVTVDSELKFGPPQNIPTERFTTAIAADGDTLAVGSDCADGVVEIGTVHMFRRNTQGGWTQQDRLLDPSGVVATQFGCALAVQGDDLFIGAKGDDTFANSSGAVHVYARDPATGRWLPSEILFGSNALNAGEFGSAIDVEGDRLIIGAQGAEGLTPLSGVVFIFERQQDGSWLEVERLQAPDGEDFDHYGASVALEGDTLVVGSDQADKSAAKFDTGGLYIYERDDTGPESWPLVAQLFASDGDLFDDFATTATLAFQGDTIVVGAPNAGNDFDPFLPYGTVYVFERNPATDVFAEVTTLDVEDPANVAGIGISVALRDDLLFVGAWQDDLPRLNAGAVFIYTRGDAAEPWVLTEKLVSSDLLPGDLFGYRIATNGVELIVGATFASSPTRGRDAGFAYRYAVYELGGTLTGMRVSQVRCSNPTSGAPPTRIVSDTGFPAWDCKDGGLTAAPGDRIVQTVTGVAAAGSLAGTIGGVNGVALACDNLTTGESASTPLGGAQQWSCQDTGLQPSPGDRVRVRVTGSVPAE